MEYTGSVCQQCDDKVMRMLTRWYPDGHGECPVYDREAVRMCRDTHPERWKPVEPVE